MTQPRRPGHPPLRLLAQRARRLPAPPRPDRASSTPTCASPATSAGSRNREKLLAAELERQVLPDGGHLSRNPSVLVELLLDLLPLRQCFAARRQPSRPRPALLAAIARMTAMLRHLRLGDGMLARFNGMGATERDVLATVLAYDESQAGTAGLRAGYVRLRARARWS